MRVRWIRDCLRRSLAKELRRLRLRPTCCLSSASTSWGCWTACAGYVHLPCPALRLISHAAHLHPPPCVCVGGLPVAVCGGPAGQRRRQSQQQQQQQQRRRLQQDRVHLRAALPSGDRSAAAGQVLLHYARPAAGRQLPAVAPAGDGRRPPGHTDARPGDAGAVPYRAAVRGGECGIVRPRVRRAGQPNTRQLRRHSRPVSLRMAPRVPGPSLGAEAARRRYRPGGEELGWRFLRSELVAHFPLPAARAPAAELAVLHSCLLYGTSATVAAAGRAAPGRPRAGSLRHSLRPV